MQVHQLIFMTGSGEFLAPLIVCAPIKKQAA
jgi:hypothetical protein